MTPPQLMPLVYFHPIFGWYCGSGKLSEEEAKRRCRACNIPYSSPSDAPLRSDPILEVTVAGTCFIPNVSEVLARLEEGQEMYLERENNPHDDNAILVLDESGTKVGYVPKASNSVIAKLMDLGESFHAVVLHVDTDIPELRVMVCMIRGRCTRRHFSVSYDSLSGPLYQMDNVPVTKLTFRYVPMSKNIREVPFTRKFTSDERWDMRWGHLSMSMDDRWNFICTRKRLYFCRSWSGSCVMMLVFGRNDEHKLIIENDKSLCNITDDSAIETINNLLDEWLEPIPIPCNMVPNGVFGNITRLPSTHKDTKYGIDEDGTITISSLK